jgi:hypothetical protein
MSKFGVGVGEEFPLDEKPRATQQDQQDEGAGCCGHGDHQARREAWRRFRQQMRAEWWARRRAMHDAFHHREGAEAIHHPHERRIHHLIIGGLAMFGLAALLGALRHRD